MEFTYYQILGVNQNASDVEIKTAYKELAKKYHPDKHGNNKTFEEHFKKINTAYQTLSNKQKRDSYDFKLKYRPAPVYPSSPSTQATPTQNAGAKRPQQRTASYSKPADETDKKLLRKVYIGTFIGLIIIVVAAIYFYNYMNRYTAEKEYNEGVKLEEEGKYHFAIQSYSAAIAYDNHFSPALAKKGLLRMMLWEDYSGAYHDFTKAIEYSETPDANLYFQRAKCLIKLQKRDEALADLNEAEKINPTADSISFYKAELYCYVFHNYEKAITQYTSALSKNKKMTDAWFGKGISEQELGMYQAAVDDISQAVNLNGKEGRFYYYRAYSYLGLKDTTSACSDWDAAMNNGFYNARASSAKFCK